MWAAEVGRIYGVIFEGAFGYEFLFCFVFAFYLMGSKEALETNRLWQG